jgi:CRP-like cAMP-binding protein
MSDHDPILLRRLLELRRFPPFAAAELAELAMLAENVVETSHEDGAIVAAPPFSEAIHLILSGKIAVGPASHGAHRAFGLLEVLARRPLATPAVAVGETRTLQITGADLREILEENFGLLLIAIRELAGRTLAARVLPRVAAPRAHALAAAAPGGSPLGLVERMIALRRQAPFVPALRERGEGGAGQTAPLEAIAILAHASKETTWPAGALIARSGDPAHSACFVLEGTVRVTRDGREPYVLGSGGSIGVIEGLAGVRHAATAEVVAPVRALEVAGSIIFDVIEDHTELGLAVIEALAGGLLDAASSLPR